MFQNMTPALIIDGTLYVLLIFSVITWTLIIFKTWQFWRNGVCNKLFNNAFWNVSSLSATKTISEDVSKGPQARIAQQGLNWLTEQQQSSGKPLKFHGKTDELLEQHLVVQMQKEEHAMEIGLTVLASISSTAPFVGLFGTVLGIMHAMHQITASGSTSLDVVAGPIGDALIATAVGIAVAVPAVLAYNFFVRRAKLQRVGLENFVTSFMHAALAENSNKTE